MHLLPVTTSELRLAGAAPDHFEAFAGLHQRAMSPSIAHTLGSHDVEFQRDRLKRHFNPELLSWIEGPGGQRFGTIAAILRPGVEIYVEQLYVEPAYQRCGVASWAMDQVHSAADQLDLPVRLKVLLESEALAFYEHLGYRLAGEVPYQVVLGRPSVSQRRPSPSRGRRR